VRDGATFSGHLADVYGIIAYFLRHRKEIDDYVQGRREEAEKLR
jgi:hypothetical protein